MSKIVKAVGSGRVWGRRAGGALVVAAMFGAVLVGAPSASASAPRASAGVGQDSCAALTRGGACTISGTNGMFLSVDIPAGVQTITAIVNGTGGPRSAAPMRGAWETVGTFSPDVVGHELWVKVGLAGENGGLGGDSVIVNGRVPTSKVVVDSGGGWARGNGFSDLSFERMASFPTLPGAGSVTLIAQSATDLLGANTFGQRSMPIPSNTHKFRVIMAGGAGSRLHNGENMEGYGGVVSAILDTGKSKQWNYYVGQSAYDGGFGFGHPGLGGDGATAHGMSGGDGGGASMLLDASSATNLGTPMIAAGGGGGAGGDNCEAVVGGCNPGGRGGSAGGAGVHYPKNGTPGENGAAGGTAGGSDPAAGVRPDGGSGGDATGSSFSTYGAGGGGGGGAGYPQGGVGGGNGSSGSNGGSGGGGGAGASFAAPGSVTNVHQSTTATCTDGFIIIIPIV